jgi:type III secretory pathway component EscU
MINTTYGLICLLVFIIMVHERCEENWTKAMRMQHLKRRHKKMHKSPILKNKRSPKKSAKKSKKWAVSQRLVVHRTLMSGVHRTVW